MPLGLGFGWLFDGGPIGGGGGSAYVSPRTVPTMLWINNTPIQRHRWTLQVPGRWLDGVSRALPDVQMVPGMTGGRYGLLPSATPRDVTLQGVFLDITLEQQQAVLAGLTDAMTGLLELRWPHAPNHVMRGVAGPLESITTVDPRRAFVGPDRMCLTVSVTIRCVDGATWSQQPRRIRLSTTARDVVMGGLPVGGEITLEGALSGSVDLDLLSPSGVRLERLALRNVALASGDVLTIRLDAPNALTKRTAAGVQTNVYHWRSLSLSSRWWKPSPRHADPARNQWPRIRASTGAGWYTYAVAHAH